ncbi:hypothetical protein HYT05_02600 [Candidatus Kaiserbacteria bacterium]|nr:hypothetical protein [Candidatus Kaiserbacteria bacterium]
MSKITFSKKTEGEVRPSFEFADPKSELREVMKRYDRQTNLIISVLIVSFIIMIIMVATLLIDSFHVNSVIYSEYSKKIDSQEQSLEANKLLLDQLKEGQIQLQESQELVRRLSK